MEDCNYKKYNSLKGLLKFEIISFYGRKFLKRRTKIIPQKTPILLDLGAGSNYKENWIQADFFLLPRLKFWKKHPHRHKPELELDLRYPIKCPDNTVDGIYSGHTLEHLYPNEAVLLLKEIFRILKSSCWLRINVPDLYEHVRFYNGEPNGLEEVFSTGCEAISDLCQNWGHRSLWDEILLSKTLNDIGFVNINKVKFGQSGVDKRLIKEKNVREKGTLVIEAQKPEQ